MGILKEAKEAKNIDWKKIGKRSRTKGKNFQGEVKKIISKYLDIPIEYFDEPIEWGGQKLGDLIIAGRYFERFPLFVEAKKRENFKLHSVFTNPNNNILVKWWRKTSSVMPEEDQYNLALVFSKNYFPIMIMLRLENFQELIKPSRTAYLNTVLKFYCDDLDATFVICLFKDFLLERRVKLGLD